uniref:Uncharacterized protein n=1 Tax=Poecilia reticulata TaxID=8081 RepID=A0A3P9NWQ6_POERE
MKAVFLCLCLAGTACAVPFSHIHVDVLIYDNNCFYFSLILFQQTFPQYGFIKYSIPQPPGRQSVEVVCADLLLFILCVVYSATINIFVMPAFDVNAQPSQDPLQQLQQDKPVQTSQVTKL